MYNEYKFFGEIDIRTIKLIYLASLFLIITQVRSLESLKLKEIDLD